MASRRSFLRLSAGLAATVVAGGCKIFGGGEKSAFAFGPMSAEVTTRTAVLWTRTTADATVFFEYSKNDSFADSARTPEVRVTADTDFVHTAQITDLTPDTRYHYRAIIADGSDKVVGA